jgi:hypothetical protein
MRTIYKFLLVLTFFGALGSCKKWSELLENPLLPSPQSADVDLYLNQVQLSFADVFNGANDIGLALTRMEVLYGPTYLNAYQPIAFNALYQSAYTGVFKNANAMIPVARSQGRFTHAGIANVLKAYTMMTMVDMFGDVPYSEANLGVENTNPKLDKGADVYAAAVVLLDTAIADFNKTSTSFPTNDLFFTTTGAAKAASWRRAAKTLKLRAYVNTRLVDNAAGTKINALLTDGELITTQAQDFTFRFSTRQQTPNARHPKYNAGYVAAGGPAGYIGTYFMYSLVAEKPVADPRARFYFYRQTINTPGNFQQQSCAYATRPSHFGPNDPYCYFITAPGYWGRDHGDNSGIPPDNQQRTVWGVYPAGGLYDAGLGNPTTLNMGGQGAGVHPIWMSFFTDFVRAEAALTVAGVTGDPRALLESGIRNSIARVTSFPTEIGHSGTTVVAPTPAQINNYVNYVLGQYDAATTTDQKLDVVLKEYYIAQWGNGLEAYNMYRRTCRPKNFQPAVQANPGAFIRSVLYPSDLVTLNVNVDQKAGVTTKVFWDTNGNCTY